MKLYIKAAKEFEDWDEEAFDIAHYAINRLKKLIVRYHPDIVPQYDEDSDFENFFDDVYALQRIFSDRDELADYVEELIVHTKSSGDSASTSLLESMLDQLRPQEPELPFNSKYEIIGFDPSIGEIPSDSNIHFNDPESAIINWMALSQERPTCYGICAIDNNAAKELLSWVVDNEDKFIEFCNQFDCIRNYNWAIDYCKSHVNSDRLIGWPGDQVDPFSLG